MDRNDDAKERIEFLEFAIQHLEARIRLVDNKATILIGIVGALGAAAAFLTKAILLENCELPLPSCFLALHLVNWAIIPLYMWRHIVLLLCLVGPPAAACFCLLMAVQPARPAFRLRVKPEQLYPGLYTLLWPRPDFEPSRKHEYNGAVSLIPSTRKAHCKATHFVLLQLVQRKYKWYRWAALFLKIWLLAGVLMALDAGLTLSVRSVAALAGAWLVDCLAFL